MGQHERAIQGAPTTLLNAKKQKGDRNAAPVDPRKLEATVNAVAQILNRKNAASIQRLPVDATIALWMLYAAATGRKDGRPISARDALELFNASLPVIQTAIDLYLDGEGEDSHFWIDDNVRSPMQELKQGLEFQAASERTDKAVLLEGRVFDLGGDASAREEGEALHAALPKLIGTLKQLNEYVVTIHEKEIEHAVEC
jgi:hypothetical protein